MKKLLFSLGLLATVAGAKDMTGKLALGGNASLAGVRGINVAFQPSKMLLVDGTLHLNHTSPGAAGADAVTRWAIAGHGFLNFADFDNSNLFIGAGINVGGNNIETNEGLDVSVELPLRPVWYFNDHFAIFTQVGLIINFMQNGVEGHDNDLIITTSTDLLGQAGVNFFF